MGIPRFLGHIRPYGVPTVLCCATANCNEHPKNPMIVIDGPGMAYYIYSRVLAYKSSLIESIDGVPSIDVIPS